MYNRILMPIDGSNASNAALTEAIKLAKTHKAQLRLVHVIDAAMLGGDIESFMNVTVAREALRQAGETLLAKCVKQAESGGIKAESGLLETFGERVPRVIAEEAKRWAADLIVMGTHGRRGFDRAIMGSVAEGVLRSSPVSALLIHGQ